jgi:hypothetical protein
MSDLRSPYPYFGGKSRIAPTVWERLGNPRNYVEPFFGSGAMLLARPSEHFDADGARTETVNDLDGMVANFWRALQAQPDAVAEHADWPVNENDLHARHAWLVGRKASLQASLEGDPEFFDAKVAGWWVWGMACWIGGGFCSGSGPWQQVDGQLVHLGSAGQGVNRQLVHLGSAGQGVNRQRVHLGSAGQGVKRKRGGLVEWMHELAARMSNVRVCCGDWARITGRSVLFNLMPEGGEGVAVFLDPPYADTAGRDADIYAVDSLTVAHDVRKWALEAVDKWPALRVALAGYEGEHVMPDSWECLAWKAKGGYQGAGNGAADANSRKERIWFSPACERPKVAQRGLWDAISEPEDQADDDQDSECET